MPQSQHFAVRAAFAALLRAVPALAGGRVYENRDFSLPAEAASSVQVYRDDATPDVNVISQQRITGAPIDWQTRLRVLIKARTLDGVSAELTADALSVDVYARAMADTSLGGLADDLVAGPIAWQQDEADAAVATCDMEFIVTHRTNNNSISESTT